MRKIDLISAAWLLAFNLGFSSQVISGTMESQDSDELSNQGSKYYYGLGVEVDLLKACQLFERAAILGNKYAQLNVGNCYRKGDGFDQDYDKALAWFKKSLESGYEEALVSIGYIVFFDAPRPKEMCWVFDQLHDLKHSMRALFLLGVIYSRGTGGERDIEASLELYERAGESGNILAAAILTEIYWHGLYSQDVDYLKSAYWRAIFQALSLQESGEGFDYSKTIEYLKERKMGLGVSDSDPIDFQCENFRNR